MGASVARVRLKEAERIAAEAEATGVPFTALLTDRAGVAAGAGRLIGLLRKARGIGRRQRTAVIIDPSERGDIPSFRAEASTSIWFGRCGPSRCSISYSAISTRRRPRPSNRQRRPGRGPVLRARRRKACPFSLPRITTSTHCLPARCWRNPARASYACGTAPRPSPRPAPRLAKRTVVASTSIFMDIHMPDMDGIEAARRIRALYPDDAPPADGRPPIVALTANAFAEDRAAYLEAGLDDYLAKPFEKADLAALLRALEASGRGQNAIRARRRVKAREKPPQVVRFPQTVT